MRSMTFFSFFLLIQNFTSAQAAPLAVIWSGHGSCNEGCAEAAGKVAKQAGYRVEFVTTRNFSATLLERASIWVQPGGDGIKAAQTLGPKRLSMIRDFVAKGGSYIGFCAGAFLADHWVDDFNTVAGLGITPVVTADFAKAELGSSETLLDINWNGKIRSVYFSEGATFKPADEAQVDVIAYYASPKLPNAPAAWENSFEKGKVVVSGVHPEAPQSWKDDTGQEDQDGDDIDLAVDLFRRAETK